MGIGDLSCTNTGWIETPAIDRLASQGLVMNNYYSAAPVSSPSRVGLTTGMFPMEWGINTYLQARKGNAACEQADYLSADAPSMARILHDAGYATGHFGKWHMGGGRDVTDAPQITRYGFDEYCSTWESPDPAPELTASELDMVQKRRRKRWERTGYFIDKTLDFLVRHQGNALLREPLARRHAHALGSRRRVAGPQQHVGIAPPTSRRCWRNTTVRSDVFSPAWTNWGLSDNTIVIFTSDNGPAPSSASSAPTVCAASKTASTNRRHPHALHHPLAGRHHAGQGGRRDRRLHRGSAALALRHRPGPLPKDYRSSGEDMSKGPVGGQLRPARVI